MSEQPTRGGRYLRQEDGTLVQIEGPGVDKPAEIDEPDQDEESEEEEHD